ncbi:MAG: hypothetical protein HYZ29_01390 [Myxococcales bacterium]|nr:hypothetical protein [Myxococcales bacterium]
MHRVALHGLEVLSDYPITGWQPGTSEAADVRISRVTPEPIPRSAPVGGRSKEPRFSVHREQAGFLVVVPEVATFVVSSNRIEVFAHARPPEHVGVLLEGLALSILLTARGDLPLHASAVRLEGETLAFVGASGAGKSTVAALLCVAGARLVSDDVLRVSLGASGPRCFAGTARIRLRDRVRAIAAFLPGWLSQETHDGRLALSPPDRPVDPGQLDAVIVPTFDAHRGTPQLVRLRGVSALRSLLGASRVPEWSDAAVLSALHAQLASLARAVPIYRADLPRLPFDETSARALLEAVRDR